MLLSEYIETLPQHHQDLILKISNSRMSKSNLSFYKRLRSSIEPSIMPYVREFIVNDFWKVGLEDTDWRKLDLDFVSIFDLITTKKEKWHLRLLSIPQTILGMLVLKFCKSYVFKLTGISIERFDNAKDYKYFFLDITIISLYSDQLYK